MKLLMLLFGGFAAMVVVMAALWARQKRTKNASAVDVAWAGGVGVLGAVFALLGPAPIHRRCLIAGIVSIWALRLASHLWARIRGAPEDRRYAALRESWGEKAPARFFGLYQLQAQWAFFFALPAWLSATYTRPDWVWTDVAGAGIAMFAIGGEALADRQLRAFLALGRKGAVCEQGLWGWSRHPNYFFEWLHWWSYVLIGWSAPFGYLLLLGPALMFLFLFRVTGIPILEASLLKTRGDAYRDYQRRVSAFFPWPRRSRTTL